jgi:hypothetical protein
MELFNDPHSAGKKEDFGNKNQVVFEAKCGG